MSRAIRRTDTESLTTPDMIKLMGMSRFQRLWHKAWKKIYAGVAIISYLLMIIGLFMTAYYALIAKSIINALLATLITLLTAYVNKSNPQ